MTGIKAKYSVVDVIGSITMATVVLVILCSNIVLLVQLMYNTVHVVAGTSKELFCHVQYLLSILESAC